MHTSLSMWVSFTGVVITLLILDLGILHKKQSIISISESLWMSLFYLIISLLFGVWIWYALGEQSAKEYLTAFVVEKSLALDNIFVISLIFSFLQIPSENQHRVLFWGVLGAIILRAIVISIGSILVSHFAWVLDIFAVFLIVTGIKMLCIAGKKAKISDSVFLKFIYKHCAITKELHGQKFFVLQTSPEGIKKLWLTPLFVALVLIEFIDLIFAIDSVPAIFAITTDPYIVYTSNIFAILGLRALYFALAVIIHRFSYLKHSLAAVLIFVGSKSFIAKIYGMEKFPVGWSLGVTCALLFVGIMLSVYKNQTTR